MLTAVLAASALLRAPSGLAPPRRALVVRSDRSRAANIRALAPIPVTDEWTTTPSGLKYIDEQVGSGEVPDAGATVEVHYTGWVQEGGLEFDSSRGRSPFTFKLGGPVIQGWNEGVATMRIGGRRRLSIPADLGYGDEGAGAIPAGATLQFECELLGTKSGVGALIALFPGGPINAAVAAVLALSFIPYLIPEGARPSFWGGSG